MLDGIKDVKNIFYILNFNITFNIQYITYTQFCFNGQDFLFYYDN